MDEEKSLLDSTHDDILKSPSESTKSNSPENSTIQPAKKISLKRNISVTIPIPSSVAESKSEQDSSTDKKESGDGSTSSDEPEKKLIKISELTSLDRLELRAKKFGNSTAAVSSSNTAAPAAVVASSGIIADKLATRAARFGITGPSSTTPSSVSSVSGPPIDILKKRAERFGAATSDTLKKSEQEEKLQKRQQRFGAAAAATTDNAVSISTASTKVDYDEKARLRAARFGTTV